MHVLIFFGFLAGIVTVLSPCILPLLPIILTSATVGGKRYPLGVVTGFILSFTFFTLFLTTLVKLLGISADLIRYISIAIILIFGLVLVVPQLKKIYELFVSKLVAKTASGNEVKKTGFFSGTLVGVSLGLVWTPCVGPILASVIALALTGSVSGLAFLITLAYALGTGVPMLIIMYGGRALLNRVPWLLRNLENIHRVFGILLIIVALALMFNLDRQFQAFITKTFPNYGASLTKIEENAAVQKQLAVLHGDDTESPTESGTTKTTKPAPELIPSGEWFNSDPFTLESLKGKVVLVDFWTYSCINCIRTLPYLQEWHEKYKDSGLVIIGVHTPEFEFEKNPKNLAKAIEDFGLTYPIVQDNDYKTWRAYKNRYWPAKYFVDTNGNIVDMHFGEGKYAESEELIRKLLKEANYDVSSAQVNTESYEIYSNTPETYLGYSRIANFASPETLTPDTLSAYTFPSSLEANRFAFNGQFLVKSEKAEARKDSKLKFNFESKNVFLVMNPIKEGTSGKVEVYLDGKKIEKSVSGKDVKNGEVKVDSARLYSLVELATPGRHTLELRFLDDNVEAYAFTFG